MAKSTAVVHGAVSIVNAIATGKGSTLGISLKVEATVETENGNGIQIESDNKSLSSKLINKTVEKIVSKKDLESNRINISLKSEIPTGYGLKSSSAISSAIALACSKIFKPKIIDKRILLAGVDASIETKVSMTGAFDDACGCYFGGFVVTDNYKRKLIKREKAPSNISAVIFVPYSRKRGNIKKLKTLSTVFEQAWDLAKKADYWTAMTLNGVATSTILGAEPKMITELIENGALGASVSGNGPAIAAVVKNENINNINKIFSGLEGKTIVSKINNRKAEVHEL